MNTLVHVSLGNINVADTAYYAFSSDTAKTRLLVLQVQ